MSKGSNRRPEDKKKIEANWDRIFNKPDSTDQSLRRTETEAAPTVQPQTKGQRK